MEDEDTLISGPEGETAAHCLYATVAIQRALDGQTESFVARWIAEIQRTPWVRTNAETVIRAYDALAEGDLRQIVGSITE